MSPRSSGVLLHITSLANRYPIGDLGPASYAFADFMRQSGQTYWQMLPVGPTGSEHSPYDGPSAFAGNPLLLSPDCLVEQGFLNRNDIESSTIPCESQVNYTEAACWKFNLLNKAFESFQRKPHAGCRALFDDFKDKSSFWLDDFSLYSAIKAKEGTAKWTKWEPELHRREGAAMTRIKQMLGKEIEFHQFIQWQFGLQWDALRSYCNQIGLQLIGDIPLFVAHQSADVWAHPAVFKLDAEGEPTVVAGVPPDCFSETGQLWNVPVYDWDTLPHQNYTWWVQRIRTAVQRFDLVRLDHFIGYVHTYEVPANDTTALNGEYRPGGGIGLFQAIRDAIQYLPFIAEDLGAKTPEVDALRTTLQIPGMRVIQFELDDSVMSPSEKTVIYTGTHDNDTTLGWYQTLSDIDRIFLATRHGENNHEINWTIIREALGSNAEMAILPMQDLLGLGSNARMNIPGKGIGNWRWRLKTDDLTAALSEKTLNLTQSYGR